MLNTSNKVVLLCGVTSFILSIIVIFGWHTQNYNLVQIHNSFAPMQYNTALGFLFSGLALVFLAKDAIRLSQISALFVLAIGGLTLAQYIFNVDFNIDQALMDHNITTKTSHSGRMAPNTALCFTLTGAAVFTYKHSRRAFFGFSVSLFILALMALLGYVFYSEDLYGWGNLTRMALHTATGFIIISLGLISYALAKHRTGSMDLWNIIPYTLASLVLIITLFFWYTAHEAANKRDQHYFETLTGDTQEALSARYNLYEQSLRGGLALFYASKSVERNEWRSYVTALDVHKNLPGINGVGFIDYVPKENLTAYLETARADGAPNFTNKPETDFNDKFIIKYIEPSSINEAAIGLDIGFEANRRAAAERARDTGEPSLTHKIQLVQDNKKQPGFLLLIPVYDTKFTPDTTDQKRDRLQGWVYAPYIGSNFMGGLTEISEGQLDFAVYDGNGIDAENLIYTSNPDITTNAVFARKTMMTLGGQDWAIEWRTTDDFTPPSQNHTPLILAISGVLFSILIYFAFSRMLESRAVIAKEVERRTAQLGKANKELVRSNKELERFAYIASHDLQEPLRKIGGFTDRLHQKLGDDLDEQGQTYMNFILDGVERMRGLIHGLLAYSRITTDKIEMETLNANEIVNLAIDNLSESVKETNTKITCGDLPTISYDKVMLTQLFQNLIGNAIKYKGDEDPIVEISAIEKGDLWEFTIKDNGMGMEEKYLERIFTMFQRLHRKEDIPGTGIGLSLCQKIVERYGGTIYVTSTPNEGSCFYFTAPKQPENNV